MINKYQIKVPCSLSDCGKERVVVIKGYCSGACKQKAYRDRDGEAEVQIDAEIEEIPISKVVFKKKAKTVTPELQNVTKESHDKWCKHGAMMGLCKYGCK